MAPKKAPATKKYETVTVTCLGEKVDVELIKPYWAEEDPEMWELDKMEKAQEKAKKILIDRRQAEEKAEGQKRIQALESAFAIFDEDGSGQLTSDEVLKVLTRMTGKGAELSEDDAKAFIKEFDRNGDGQLSINEFITAMGVMSDAYDADGDGVADMKQGGGEYDGKEEDFAAKLAAGETLEVAGVASGNMSEAVDEARRLQK